MKAFILAVSLLVSASAFANAKFVFSGSDTLAGVMTDAIIASGLDQQMQYAGGGSGLAEKNMVSGDQGLGPMSREMKPEFRQQMLSAGVTPVDHIIGLDGISLFVKASNPVASLDLPTLTRIFTCEFVKWEQIPNSGLRGQINAYRRNDASGTTDAFKHFTGLKQFGACVKVMNETADIAEATARDGMGIGYAGLSGKIDGNRAVAIARTAGAPAIQPTTATIRNFSYPLSRNLYIYEVTGSRAVNEVEQQLLDNVTDRSFMDPIMQAHEFITID